MRDWFTAPTPPWGRGRVVRGRLWWANGSLLPHIAQRHKIPQCIQETSLIQHCRSISFTRGRVTEMRSYPSISLSFPIWKWRKLSWNLSRQHLFLTCYPCFAHSRGDREGLQEEWDFNSQLCGLRQATDLLNPHFLGRELDNMAVKPTLQGGWHELVKECVYSTSHEALHMELWGSTVWEQSLPSNPMALDVINVIGSRERYRSRNLPQVF